MPTTIPLDKERRLVKRNFQIVALGAEVNKLIHGGVTGACLGQCLHHGGVFNAWRRSNGFLWQEIVRRIAAASRCFSNNNNGIDGNGSNVLLCFQDDA